ncbi:MAG: hypothetical protein ACJ79A_19900 [Gemmatimonadaceae bacterium]
MATVVAAAACTQPARIETSSGGEVVSAAPASANSLPAGTTMTARLEQSLGTKSNKVGDQFTATTTEAVVAQNGQTVVPAGAKVYGHVTGLHSPTVTGEQAVIRLDFDSLAFSGRRYPFKASINSVAVAGQTTGSTSTTVKSAGVGAAAGAVLGAVLSGGELDKIITGGLLGAAAGTVISLGRGDVESVLPAGSTLTVRSTEAVALR